MTKPKHKGYEASRRLGDALRLIGFAELADQADRGHFSDFSSQLATPKLTLVKLLFYQLADKANVKKTPAIMALRKRIMEGEFDG